MRGGVCASTAWQYLTGGYSGVEASKNPYASTKIQILGSKRALVSPLSRTGLTLTGRRAPKAGYLPGTERRPPTTRGARERGCGTLEYGAHELVRDLVRVRARQAPPAMRSAASSAWARRWWAMLAASVQQAMTRFAFGLA